MELKLKSDTAKRKRLFTAESFSHPAKCHLGMLEWILQEYTKEGEVVLDPMSGSGSILLGTLMGRHIGAVELEAKFVKMCQDNLKKLSSQALYLGTKERGQAVILQGDARDLTGLLADSIITSPPFGDAIGRSSSYYDNIDTKNKERIVEMAKWYGDMSRYSNSEGQIGNLPYGSIDHIVSSPPYSNAYSIAEGGQIDDKYVEKARARLRKQGKYKLADSLRVEQYNSRNPDNIGNLPHGDISAIISSPPYENVIAEGDAGPLAHAVHDPSLKDERHGYTDKVDHIISSPPYEGSLIGKDDPKLADTGRYKAENDENIGNLKSTDYLSAMFAVYQQCYAVLKPGGLLLLITKNFIRDQKEIRLDSDTIALCEEVGFMLKERHFRRLTQQSFWRTIYRHKFPDAPVLDKEDILVFVKQAETAPMELE